MGGLACLCQVTRDTRERYHNRNVQHCEMSLSEYRPCMSVASRNGLFVLSVSTPCCVPLIWWWDSLQEAVCWECKYNVCHVQVLQSKITVGSNRHWWVCTRWADGCIFWCVKPLRNCLCRTVLASCLSCKAASRFELEGWLYWTMYTMQGKLYFKLNLMAEVIMSGVSAN